ncbi:MAG TPA: hypothetical protein VE978_25135 [Chitinophagales bacterium]|nr:hypothetical protein [Chitinophagales bacterium]
MESELQKITSEIIIRNFDLEEISSNENLLEKIRALLIDRIDFLLDHDFEKLLWILYRIDVSEEKAKAALAVTSEKRPAEVLADMIIERQIEKARTRTEFRNKAAGDDYNAGE